MKLEEARCLCTVLLVVAVTPPAARGLLLDLPSSGTNCVSEGLPNNVVVLADYYVFIGEEYGVNNIINPTISIKVTSPSGNNLYYQEKVSHGQFAFTTTESGNYLACFSRDSDHGGKKVTVGFKWKTGIAAKDWDSVARKEKIEGLELRLKRLEELHQSLIYRINRKVEMRAVSEATDDARLGPDSKTFLAVSIVVSFLCFSIIYLGVCIGVWIFHRLWFLRRYFQKEKLI